MSASRSSEVGIIRTDSARRCKSWNEPFRAESRIDAVIIGVSCCLCLAEVFVDVGLSDANFAKSRRLIE